MRPSHIRYSLTALLLFIAFLVVLAGCLKWNDPSEKVEKSEKKRKEMLVTEGLETKVFAELDSLVDLDIDGDRLVYLTDGKKDGELELTIGSINSKLEIVETEHIHSIKIDQSVPDEVSVAWVPKLNKIAYMTKNEGAFQLQLFDVDKKEEMVVHSFKKGTHPSNVDFAQSEKQYFYAETTFGDKPSASIVMNNFEMTAAMDLIEVKAEVPDKTPIVQYSSISPDRRWLAYTKYNQDSRTYNLWVHDLTTNTSKMVTDKNVEAGKPSWSLNAQVLSYVLSSSENRQSVHAYDVLNEQSYRITEESESSFSPAWVGETQLVFGRTDKNVATVYMADLKGILGQALSTKEGPKAIEEEFDLAILNGTVMDPDKETIKFGYNIGVKDGKIAQITQASIQGKEIIDGENLVVSPGFIDILSYNPNNVGNIYKVTDGVTTNLAMHGAVLDFESYFRAYAKQPMIINYGGAIQQVKMRMELGLGRYDSPTPEQIEKMKVMTEKAIKEGAIGISFSPEYYPGISPEEIKAIMGVGKKYGMTTFFHVRYSTMEGEKTNIDALEEVIGYARELDAAVQVSHINSTGGTFSMEQSLNMIQEARKEGLDVSIDIYPYNYWATYANSARFDEGWRERFRIDYGDLQVGGSTERLTKESFEKYRQTRTLLIAYAIPEEDVELSIQEEHAMIGSDTIIQPGFNNHPRGAGTFARTIGKYARDKNVIPLMQALQMMTINTVKRLENVTPDLQTKGRLQEGMDADITIFDYSTIKDTATPENTIGISEGIPYVIVNGVIVKDTEGVRKHVSPGKPIRSYFK